MATGNGEARAVDGRLLEQQRLAAAGRFHFAIRDLGDLQLGGHGDIDPLQLAGLVERGEKMGEGASRP